MRRLIFFFLLMAGPAAAAGPPGPAPWRCIVHQACDEAGQCVWIGAAPLGFALHEFPFGKDTYVIDAFRGQQMLARRFMSLGQAEEAVGRGAVNGRTHVVLVPTGEIADAHAFRMFNIARRGGERVVMQDNLLISCNSLLRP